MTTVIKYLPLGKKSSPKITTAAGGRGTAQGEAAVMAVVSAPPIHRPASAGVAGGAHFFSSWESSSASPLGVRPPPASRRSAAVQLAAAAVGAVVWLILYCLI